MLLAQAGALVSSWKADLQCCGPSTVQNDHQLFRSILSASKVGQYAMIDLHSNLMLYKLSTHLLTRTCIGYYCNIDEELHAQLHDCGREGQGQT